MVLSSAVDSPTYLKYQQVVPEFNWMPPKMITPETTPLALVEPSPVLIVAPQDSALSSSSYQMLDYQQKVIALHCSLVIIDLQD